MRGIWLLGVLWTVLFGMTVSPSSGDASAADDAPRPVARPKIAISKETTWIEGPLREDGYVDYVAAVNRHYGKGVTPQNNAAVPLWRAIGPGELEEEFREPFFRHLGMEPLPEDGKYLERLEDYLERHPDTPLAGMNDAE